MFENVFSLEWWLVMLVGGVPVGLVSALLLRALDRVIRSLKASSLVREESNKNLLERLRGDKHLQLIYAVSEARYRSRGMTNAFWGALNAVSAVFLYFAGVGILVSLLMFVLTVVIVFVAFLDLEAADRVEANLQSIHKVLELS
ncbi:hypothetical protein [Agaribacterium sp. ZY112]|uniref:hypothetical protein n=1 Tax=Agaribacterium sp. ZY112 TaxID=3233574 RepID=UPI0035256FBC